MVRSVHFVSPKWRSARMSFQMVGDHGVYGVVVRAQGYAAVARGPAVHHGGRAEIAREPAVAPEGPDHPHGVAQDEARHLAPGAQPPGEVVGRVHKAAPLAAVHDVRLFNVAVAHEGAQGLAFGEVFEAAPFFLKAVLRLCHHAPSFCSAAWMRFISSDSTKAWKRVLSWPEAAQV